MRLKTLIDACVYEMEVEIVDLYQGASRVPRLVLARQALWKVMRDYGFSFGDIKYYFGFDHTTVLYGLKNANQEDVERIKVLATRLEQTLEVHDRERFIENYGKQG